jgi:predicted nucleotidyltransferase
MLRVVDGRTIEEAARTLLAAAPGSKVILFGSHARGQADPGSDVDFLVVEPEVKDAMGEEVRLREALGSVDFAVDVLVMSRRKFDYWKDTPNTLPYEVEQEGKVYESLA